jgi:hypothetical protein
MKAAEKAVLAPGAPRAFPSRISGGSLTTATSRVTARSRRAARSAFAADGAETLMGLLDDGTVAAAFENHVHIEGGATVAAFSARTARTCGAALPSAARWLLVVSVAAVLAFASRATDAALPPRLAIAAGKDQCDDAAGIAGDDQLYPLGSVAAVQPLLPGRSAKPDLALTPSDTGIVMIPPQRPAVIAVGSLGGVELWHSTGDVSISGWRNRAGIVPLYNPFRHSLVLRLCL